MASIVWFVSCYAKASVGLCFRKARLDLKWRCVKVSGVGQNFGRSRSTLRFICGTGGGTIVPRFRNRERRTVAARGRFVSTVWAWPDDIPAHLPAPRVTSSLYRRGPRRTRTPWKQGFTIPPTCSNSVRRSLLTFIHPSRLTVES